MLFTAKLGRDEKGEQQSFLCGTFQDLLNPGQGRLAHPFCAARPFPASGSDFHMYHTLSEFACKPPALHDMQEPYIQHPVSIVTGAHYAVYEYPYV